MSVATRIFVSHDAVDTAWTRPFVARLRQSGADVWFDEHDTGDMKSSDEVDRELRNRPPFW
jgi:hypothetical protein